LIKEPDAAQFHHCQIIPRRFVVACGNAAVLFQMTEAPLNNIAIAVGVTILNVYRPFNICTAIIF